MGQFLFEKRFLNNFHKEYQAIKMKLSQLLRLYLFSVKSKILKTKNRINEKI